MKSKWYSRGKVERQGMYPIIIHLQYDNGIVSEIIEWKFAKQADERVTDLNRQARFENQYRSAG